MKHHVGPIRGEGATVETDESKLGTTTVTTSKDSMTLVAFAVKPRPASLFQ